MRYKYHKNVEIVNKLTSVLIRAGEHYKLLACISHAFQPHLLVLHSGLSAHACWHTTS